MAEFTWNFDAVDGVYKNHALSNKLLEHSALQFVVSQFADSVSGFGRKNGESVDLVHYKSLDTPADWTLAEQNPMPIDQIEMGKRQITVTEWGRGAEYTNLSEELSKFSPKDALQKALMDQMKRCQDIACAQAVAQAKIKYIPTGAGAGTWDTDGTASTAMAADLDIDHLGIIRDYLAKDLHAPPYEGGDYVGLFSTTLCRSVKSDADFVQWKQYLKDGDLLYRSEIGKIEGIRIVECTLDEALSNSIGSGSAYGEGFVFGDEAVSRVEAVAPHLRADPNYQSDFGRRKAVAWYGILAYGITWDTANDREAKVIHISS